MLNPDGLSPEPQALSSDWLLKRAGSSWRLVNWRNGRRYRFAAPSQEQASRLVRSLRGIGVGYIGYDGPELNSVLLHLTSQCNLACSHCYVPPWSDRLSDLDLSTLRSSLGQAAEIGADSVLLSGGEPFASRKFPAVVDQIEELMLRVGAVFTNGLLVPNHRPLVHRMVSAFDTRFCVSLDGVRMTHDRIRNFPGAYGRTVHALETLKDAGASLVVNSLLHRGSIPDLPTLFHVVYSLGVHRWRVHPHFTLRGSAKSPNLAVSPSQGLDAYLTVVALWIRHGRPFELELGNLFRGGQLARVEEAYAPGSAVCGYNARRLVIWADGAVSSCTRLRGHEPHGTLRETPLRQLWESREMRALKRVKVKSDRCVACEHLQDCGGGCPGEVYVSTGVVACGGCSQCELHRSGHYRVFCDRVQSLLQGV